MVELNDNLRKKLVGRLKARLPTLNVKNNVELELRKLFEALDFVSEGVSKTSALGKRLLEWVGEDAVISILYDFLTEEVRSHGKYSPDAPIKKLIEIPAFSDVEELSGRAVSVIESLPISYTFIYILPNSFSERLLKEGGFPQMEGSPSLILGSASLRERFADVLWDAAPYGGGLYNALAQYPYDNPVNWSKDAVYLLVDVLGYVDRFGNSNTVKLADRTLRSFFGLCISGGIFQYNEYMDGLESNVRAFSLRRDTNSLGNTAAYDVRRGIALAIDKLSYINLGNFLGQSEERLASNECRLSSIEKAFRNSDDAMRVRKAAQWLFDSYSSDDNLLGFVQAMISIEILLGDKRQGELGVGELLSNRLAYLISDRASERTDIMQEFKRIYSVRSEIVHRGQDSLSRDETKLLHRLRWVCARAIKAELQMLPPDSGE